MVTRTAAPAASGYSVRDLRAKTQEAAARLSARLPAGRLSDLPRPALDYARRMLTTGAAAKPDEAKTKGGAVPPAATPAKAVEAKSAAPSPSADAKVPPPPIQNEEVPSGSHAVAKASSTDGLGKEEAKAEAAEAKAKASAGEAAAAAVGLSRPKAPAYIRDSGVNLRSLWRRGREALAKLPAMVGHFTMEYLVKYPSETVWWALTDRPKFKARMAYVWDVVKHEAQHMWLGFKLLGVDVRTSWRLVQRVLRGHTLTRRERKQLMRTTSDLFRLVPFSIFIIVPGGEALIPVALKVFPNLLPSTFASQDSKAAEQKKILQMRVELATFLQHTMEFMGQQIQTKSGKDKDKDGAQGGAHGNQLMQLVRSAREGRVLEAEDIVAVSRIFKDEITLENIGRHELISMARLLGISAFGTDGFLRYQIRSKIRAIKADDSEIKREGLDALSKEELAEACRERGMRASGLTEGGLRDQLQQWLDLSTRNEVPLSLLILSRALTFAAPIKDTGAPEPSAAASAKPSAAASPAPAPAPAAASSSAPSKPSGAAMEPVAASDGGTPSTSMERALQASIAHLGDTIVEEALLDAAERSGDTDELSVAQMRLRSLERENELIEMERRAKDAAADAHELAKKAEEAAAVVAEARRSGDESGLSASMHQAASAAQSAAKAGQLARDAYAELRRKAAGEVAEAVSRRRRRKAADGEEDAEPYAVDASLVAALGEDAGIRELASAARALRSGGDAADGGAPEDLRELGREEAEALLAMAGASALQQERARLAKIKAARLRMEAVEMLARGRIDAAKAAVDKADDAEAAARDDGAEAEDADDDDAASQLAKDTAASRVKTALDSLLVRLEGDMEAADESLGATLTLLDRDDDGVVSADELQAAILDVLGNRNMEKAAAAIVERLDADRDGAVTVAEVKRYAELRAQAEAEADWMHPDEVRKAVDQARGDMDDEKSSAKAAAKAFSDDDDDDDDMTPSQAQQPPASERR